MEIVAKEMKNDPDYLDKESPMHPEDNEGILGGFQELVKSDPEYLQLYQCCAPSSTKKCFQGKCEVCGRESVRSPNQ